MPAPLQERSRLAREHPCPTCHAVPGEPCRQPNGAIRTHNVRGVDPALLRHRRSRGDGCPCGGGDLHRLCGQPVTP